MTDTTTPRLIPPLADTVFREVPTREVKIGDKLAHLGNGYPVVHIHHTGQDDTGRSTRVVFAVQRDGDTIDQWENSIDGTSAIVVDVSVETETLARLVQESEPTALSPHERKTIARHIIANVKTLEV